MEFAFAIVDVEQFAIHATLYGHGVNGGDSAETHEIDSDVAAVRPHGDDPRRQAFFASAAATIFRQRGADRGARRRMELVGTAIQAGSDNALNGLSRCCQLCG